MKTMKCVQIWLLVCGLAIGLQPAHSEAEIAAKRDGQHDFDHHAGSWNSHVTRLKQPLTGSTAWVEYDGITVVRPIWDGRASLGELTATGSAGQIQVLSLRLYNPASRQWSLNFANSQGGTLSPPCIGEFKGDRGEFISQEDFNGRSILVRFVITKITEDSVKFEQAFSDDGGKNWEINLVVMDTRVKDKA
jgi:hypothetical protein